MAAESKPAAYAALAGNVSIAVLKFVVALFTGSAAMLAEAFHSTADSGNQALLLFGMRSAQRPPDAEHPFGHGMSVYFWGFVVSVMLFTVGGGFSLWEALRTFLHGEDGGQEFTWAYIVLGGSAVFEGTSLAFAVRTMLREKDPGDSFARFWRESRDPALMTVLLEDSTALVSLAVAALGLFLTRQTGSQVWDGLASAVIGLLLLGIALALAAENYSLLLGESAPADVEQRIRGVVAHDPSVERLVFLRTMHLGPDAVLVAIGARFVRSLSVRDVETAIARLEQTMTEALEGLASRRRILIEPVGAEPDPRTS